MTAYEHALAVYRRAKKGERRAALKALQRVVHEEMRRQRAERFETREAA